MSWCSELRTICPTGGFDAVESCSRLNERKDAVAEEKVVTDEAGCDQTKLGVMGGKYLLTGCGRKK